jgi:hypothetical protein
MAIVRLVKNVMPTVVILRGRVVLIGIVGLGSIVRGLA